MIKKAVLFDLDNTLYEYDSAHNHALKATWGILKKEISISLEKFLKLYALSQAEIHRELAGTAAAHNRVLYFQRLIEKTHNTIEPEIILRLYNGYWDTFLKNMKLRKGVLETLKELKKKGLKIAIVSDLTTDIQLRKMNKLRITSYIDVLVTSEEAGSEKPHPIMFLLTLNKLKILPEDALYVGDNPVNDIEGANAVGLDSVLLKGREGYSFNENYKKPNYVIENIQDVLEILKK
jgi:putative hydrolase of the HAD superfamily